MFRHTTQLVAANRRQSRNTSKALRRATGCAMMETMEGRRLLTASLSNTGLLNIVGTDAADTIGITSDSINGTVTETSAATGTVTSDFLAGRVHSIVITARGGNDNIQVGILGA